MIIKEEEDTIVYVISVDEDGGINVRGMSREVFILAINTTPDDDYRGFELVAPEELRSDIIENDPMYWGKTGRVLAIEGRIITVEPVSEVTAWRIANE